MVTLSPSRCEGKFAAMAKEIKSLLEGGYCHFVRNTEPLVIGEDFDAPAPIGRVLPRIKLDEKTWDQLWLLVPDQEGMKSASNSDAAIFKYVERRQNFENSVSEALNWHVSDHQFQADLPQIRKHLIRLKTAIENFR